MASRQSDSIKTILDILSKMICVALSEIALHSLH